MDGSDAIEYWVVPFVRSMSDLGKTLERHLVFVFWYAYQVAPLLERLYGFVLATHVICRQHVILV